MLVRFCSVILLSFALTAASCGGDAKDCTETETDCSDGVDNDCDGATDADDSDCASCEDADSDGYQDDACGGDDCDDTDDAVHPGASEVCDNNVDDDCDGDTDTDDSECPAGCDDADEDGYPDESCGGTDCDDADASVNPGADEVCDNGVDDDCDGDTDTDDDECPAGCDDADEDGYPDESCGGTDCDDDDASVNPGADEVCDNGIDDDCDGDTDTDDGECPAGCDDTDEDGYADQSCGGTDCDDSDPDVNPGADEICDNVVDDDCDGDTDTDDDECPAGCDDADEDGYTDQACGGSDCDDGDPDIHPGVPEMCDEVDQDCDGMTDLGCDDDGDGWCDDALPYDDGGAGSLTVCDQGPGDCNDDRLSGAAFHPGADEVCDGMDNDCDGETDESCTSQPPVADAGPDRFPPERDDPINWVTLDANGSFDPDNQLPLTYAWSCTVGTIGDPAAALTTVSDIPCSHPTATPIVCTVTVTDTEGLSDDDSMQIVLSNNVPTALVTGTPDRPGRIVVRAAADTDPDTTLVLDGSLSSDPDGCHASSLVFAWTGPDAGLLSDTAVAAPTMPNDAGTYDLTLTVTDPEGASDSVDVLVVASECVWVGTGCPAAVPSCRLVDTSPGGMDGRITEALDIAEAEDYLQVCLAPGDYTEDELLMRPGVGIQGGYQADWTFDGNPARASVLVRDPRGVYFGPGASGASLDSLTAQADPADDTAEQRAAVTVDGAAALVTGCRLEGDNASTMIDSGAYGVWVLDGPAGLPVVIAGNPEITGAATTTPSYAIGVRADSGEVLLLGSPVGLVGPRQTIRGGPSTTCSFGVYVDGVSGARLEARNNYLVHGCSWGGSSTTFSAGVFLDGGSGHVLEGTEDIQGCSAPDSFGVYTQATGDTRIEDNGLVMGRGTSYSAAVADGYLSLFGDKHIGGSTGLQIVGNRSLWGSDIHQVDDNAPTLSAGIWLVDTEGALVADNGRRIDTGYGEMVIGGRVSNFQEPGSLEPVAPGLWTIDCSDIQVERNYLHAGIFTDTPGDDLPAVALQDGRPVRDDLIGDDPMDSDGLVFDANAIVSDVPALDAPMVELSRSVAVRLFGTEQAVFTNNLIATMSGNHLFGVVLEGASARLVNNSIDLDMKLHAGFACPAYVARFGIYGVEPRPDSVLVNNAVLLRHLDDPACGGIKPNDDQAAMWFVQAGAAADVPLGRFEHNVLFMQGDDLGTAYTPDYVVSATDHYDGAPSVLGAWAAGGINNLPGVTRIGGNAVADPVLIDGSTGDWQRAKTDLHLGPGSACIDAGLTSAAPDHDYYGHTRPAGTGADVGHEEIPD